MSVTDPLPLQIPVTGLHRTANLVGRKETVSMLDGILHNTRQQEAQDRAAAKKDNANAETASVSTFSSERPLLRGSGSGSGLRNFFKRS